MILAAGFGTRMKPLSDRCPKPLLPVLGRPLIDHTIDRLRTVAIEKIGVNVHHGADKVEAYLLGGSPRDVTIAISRETKILGTGGGMEGMRDFLSEEGPFLVHNGDVFSDIDLPDLVACHRSRAPMVTMALRNYTALNNVTVSPEGIIVDFLGKRAAGRVGKDNNLTFTGLSVVDPAVFAFIPRNRPSSIIDTYLDLLDRKPGSICGYVAQGSYWIDVGTPASYLQVHRDALLNEKTMAGLGEFQGKEVYRGTGTEIEAGAQLTGFVSLGNRCRVKKGAHLENCVVWNDTVVEKETRLSNGVIDGKWTYNISS
jgi:NDP-sugar pyrophosphorylase family protein